MILSPARAIDRAIERSLAREQERCRQAITREPRTSWASLLLLLILCGAVVTVSVGHASTSALGIVARAVALTFVGSVAGLAIGGQQRRAARYRQGWYDGRAAMFGSIGESLARGMSPGEWLASEAERDLANMGVRMSREDLDEGEQ